MNAPNISVGVRGTFLGCPVEVRVEKDNGSLCYEGILHVHHKGVGDFLDFVDPDLLRTDEPVRALVDTIDSIVGHLSFDMDIRHCRGLTCYELEIDPLHVRIIATGGATALAVLLSKELSTSQPGMLGWILSVIQKAQSTLGIETLLLVYCKGPGIPITDLTGSSEASALPAPLSKNKWLAYGRFLFPADSQAGRAIADILGIRGLDAYLGMDPINSKYLFCLAFGAIDNGLFASRELYVMVGIDGNVPTFSFRGSFQFKFLPQATFTANCDFSMSSFILAASLDATDRIAIPFIPGFYLAEAGLLVGILQGAPTFGLFATIYVRDLMVFGAIMVAVEGGIPTPRLVSGAIDPISLPILFRNLSGIDIAGLNALDVISLDRLAEIQLPGDFDPVVLKEHNADALASLFNRTINNPTLNLDPDRIHIRTLPRGYALVDQARMRHYFVESSGKVSLQSQFYLSIQPTPIQFGSYTIQPGIFFCGAVVLFGKRFEALFCLRKDEGVLAYAKIDRLEFRAGSFTVFALRASDDPTKDPRPIGSGGLADQFIPAHPTGLVFFLTASKKEVSFYLSGHVEFLGLFQLDVRFVYAARILSLHTEIRLWGIRIVLQLDASWGDLTQSRFFFLLSIDTSALAEALKAVTQAIDQAIENLKTTISRAQTSLNDAIARVNQLHLEIYNLDRLIAACVSAIQRASWWTRTFVAIAKGAEIAAYEVAKVGIWTAIGVATAALNLAKLVVAAFGSLSVGLLELVNATIRAATNLLFLHSAEISADISPQLQKFKAAIAFRALGKEYQFSAAVSLDILNGNVLDFLSKQLLSLLSPDLQRVSSGSAPRILAADRRRVKTLMLKDAKAKRMRGTGPADIPAIEGASREIDRVTKILDLLQVRYRETFGEDLAEFAQLNAKFTTALHLSSSSLKVAAQATGDETYVALLKRVKKLNTSKLSPTRKRNLQSAIDNLSRALDADKHVVKAAKSASKARTAALRRAKVANPSGQPLAQSPREADERMVKFLHDLELEIHNRYGDELTGYINLSMEQKLTRYFARAHSKLGSRRATDLRARTKRRKAIAGMEYRNRL